MEDQMLQEQNNKILEKNKNQEVNEEDEEEDYEEDSENQGQNQSSQQQQNGNTSQHNNKKQKMFRCTFNGCGKAYSHTSGIRHHQREKHGQYNPDYYEKVDQQKANEKRGRPKLQIKKEIQQTNLEEFFKKLEDQEQEEEKNNPGCRKKIKYVDKKMCYLLEKNIKFVLSVITEFGDPIVHSCKTNLFIEEWDQFQNDPWKDSNEKTVDWDDFFDNQLEQYNAQGEQMQIQTRKLKEFIQRVIQDLKQEIYSEFINIFKLLWNYSYVNVYTEEIVVSSINNYISQNPSQFTMFDMIKPQNTPDLTREQFIEYIIHGTLAYVKDTPNEKYDTYFGYVNKN